MKISVWFEKTVPLPIPTSLPRENCCWFGLYPSCPFSVYLDGSIGYILICSLPFCSFNVTVCPGGLSILARMDLPQCFQLVISNDADTLSLVYFPTDGHLACFQFPSVSNSAVADIQYVLCE